MIQAPIKSVIDMVDLEKIDVRSIVAAGWAREMLELSDARTLGAQFERVWLNGRRIK